MAGPIIVTHSTLSLDEGVIRGEVDMGMKCVAFLYFLVLREIIANYGFQRLHSYTSITQSVHVRLPRP